MTSQVHARLVLASVVGALVLPGSVQAQLATEIGPAPTTGFGGAAGRISSVACHPSDPSRYYVAGADGGVWRTTDAGVTWRALTDSQPTTATGCIALDPTNPSIIYAGTGEANFANHSRYGLGILQSTNGGDSWTLLATPTFAGRCISRIVIDSTNHNVLYASVTEAGGFPERAGAKGHPLANGPRGVFKSTDAGVSWSQLAGGLPNMDATDVAMDQQHPAILFAAIGHIFGDPANGVYRSTDSGLTWTRSQTGLPIAGCGRIGLAAAPSNGQRLYCTVASAASAAGAGAVSSGGFRSDNGGVSWTQCVAGSGSPDYNWYYCSVGVSPVNPDLAGFGALNVSLSTNGSTFAQAVPPHPDVHALSWDAAGRLVIGCDGGVYRTTNSGGAWQSLNTGLGTIQFYAGLSTHPTNPNYVIGGTQDNGTNLRNSATPTWSLVLDGDGGWTQVSPFNPQIVLAESQGTGNLARSSDGGLNFVDAGSGLTGRNCFEPPFLFDWSTPNRMLYATERVWQSTNNGTTWTALSPDLTAGGSAAIRALAIAPSNAAFVYATTNDGRVQRSTDHGATFQLVRTGNPGWPRVTRELCIDPADPMTVYLAVSAFGSEHVLRTTNGGASWQRLDQGLPDVPVNVIAVDRRSIGVSAGPTIYAGTDGGLFMTINEGLSWRNVGQLPHVPVIDLVLEIARGRMIVGTQGRGAWTLPVTSFCSADFNGDGDVGTDQDIEALFACLAGNCCPACGSADFNADGDSGTDSDIESFFRVLAGGGC